MPSSGFEPAAPAVRRRQTYVLDRSSARLVCRLYHSFIHSLVRFTTGPKPLPKRLLHWIRSSDSSFSFQYPALSWMSSSSCLRLLSRHSIPSILLSIMCFTRQIAFLLFAVCRIFLSSLTVWEDRDNIVGIATRYGLDGQRIESRWRQGFLHPSKPALGTTQATVHWVRDHFTEGKATGTWRWSSTL